MLAAKGSTDTRDDPATATLEELEEKSLKWQRKQVLCSAILKTSSIVADFTEGKSRSCLR